MKNLFCLLFFFNVLHLSFADLTKCLNYFNNTSAAYSTLFSSSGKHLFDLGLYDTCIKNPNNTFIVLITPVFISSQLTGLCVPNFCTPSDFNEYILPQVINPILPAFASAVDPQSHGQPIGAGSIAVLVILAIFLFISIIGPIFRIAKGFVKNDDVPQEQNALLENNQHKEKKNGIMIDLLNAFSLDLNLKKIFTLRESKLDFFNCLRALSLLYVIFGHEFLLRINQTLNISDLSDIMKAPIFLLAAGGFYAVDVFYYLSGFFLAFVVIEGNLKYIFF